MKKKIIFALPKDAPRIFFVEKEEIKRTWLLIKREKNEKIKRKRKNKKWKQNEKTNMERGC